MLEEDRLITRWSKRLGTVGSMVAIWCVGESGMEFDFQVYYFIALRLAQNI